MDNFIYELLKENKSVILPEFGNLSYTDEAKGTVMFNPYIKFNDGKLEKFLCEKHGLEKQDAINRIAKFVKDLELKINTGEPYSIFQVGRFVKTNQGDIDFESWGTYESVGAPPAADTLSKPDEVQEIPVKEETRLESTGAKMDVTETVNDTLPSAAEHEKQPKKEVITEEEVELIKPVYEKTADRTLTAEETKQMQNKFIPTQTENENSETIDELPKTEKGPEKGIATQEKPVKKRGVGIYLLAFILLVLGGGVTYIGFNLEEVKQQIGLSKEEAENKPTPELIEQPEEDEIGRIEDDEAYTPAADEFVEEEIIEPITPVKPVSAPAVEGSFHIIVGSFSQPENAANLATNLKAKGYPAQVIGPINGMHMVSFGAFSSRENAQENLSKANEETGGGWIMKR